LGYISCRWDRLGIGGDVKTKRLGSSGPEISVVGFGAWEAGGMAWGPNPPDDQTLRAMRTAIDNGINWIDTAEAYGDGRSEELVGQAVAGTDAMVFTKVAPRPGGSGVDAASVRSAAEGSLARLGRDVIDLYQVHWPDRSGSVPLGETWSAMAQLVDDGLVRHIGLSNFDVEQIAECERIRHVDSIQPHFSMLWLRGRRDLFPWCETNGTGVIAYGPLGYGLLTGAVTRETEFGEDDWRGGGHGQGLYDKLFAPGPLEENLAKADALRIVADRLGITLAQLALAWVFHQEGVTAAIAGSRSPDHVAENAGAGDVSLDRKNLDEIEEIIASR
jgi:aryl-alcohol dehydrogenase-like predicted oxidoreductase